MKAAQLMTVWYIAEARGVEPRKRLKMESVGFSGAETRVEMENHIMSARERQVNAISP